MCATVRMCEYVSMRAWISLYVCVWGSMVKVWKIMNLYDTAGDCDFERGYMCVWVCAGLNDNLQTNERLRVCMRLRLCESVYVCMSLYETVWVCVHLCDTVRDWDCMTLCESVRETMRIWVPVILWDCAWLCDSVWVCLIFWGIWDCTRVCMC